MQTLAVIPLSHWGTKAAPDNAWIKGRGCVPRKLDLWKGAGGWIWPTGSEWGGPRSEVPPCGLFLVMTEVELLLTYLMPIRTHPSVNCPCTAFALHL